MGKRRLADFLFVGAGVVPLVLALGGQPGPGVMLMIPLLFIGCLLGMAELVEDKRPTSDD